MLDVKTVDESSEFIPPNEAHRRSNESENWRNLGNLCIFENLCIGNEVQGNISENTAIKSKFRKSMQLWELNVKELMENI